jgi:hypothetical protein
VALLVEVYAMLKTLITKLAKTLFRPKYNPGYQTRVYPRLGEMIIVHDTLDFGPTAMADELLPTYDFWLSDETPDTDLLAHSYHEDTFTLDSSPDINPASGLPMMDALFDVAGNVYGMNSCEIDCTHSSFETDAFI